MDAWPFPDPPDLGVFITQDLLDGADLRLVEHDLDGDWAFSGGESFEEDRTHLVHLSWVASHFDVAREAADLPPGRGRRLVGAEWMEYQVLDEDE